METMRVYIEAVKDIPPGAEILVQYGKEYWDVIRHNLRIDEREKARTKKEKPKKKLSKKPGSKKRAAGKKKRSVSKT